jgi:predicted transcriptional regulator
MSKVFVATRIEAKTHDALIVLAKQNDRTVSYLLRKAAESYVNREPKRKVQPK